MIHCPILILSLSNGDADDYSGDGSVVLTCMVLKIRNLSPLVTALIDILLFLSVSHCCCCSTSSQRSAMLCRWSYVDRMTSRAAAAVVAGFVVFDKR